MNEKDSEVNGKALDSLLNFETVKYFNAEEREIKKYSIFHFYFWIFVYHYFDTALQNYFEFTEKSQWLVSIMNAGQALLIGSSVGVAMCIQMKKKL